MGVKVVGPVPAGLPQLTIPVVSAQDILALLPAALALTILIYADEVLTARVFAAKHGQKMDSNQELVALGMANIGAGFLTGFPAALSASRTAVSDQMGGKTQWVGLIAAGLTIIFLLFLTPLLAPLPTAVLGAIIIVASIGLLDVAAFRFLRKVARSEFWLALVTTLGVLTVGVLQGIFIALILSLVNVLFHIARPHDAVLDDIDASGGTVYREVSDKETALAEPGLIVYRFDAPLVFANAAFFTERIEELMANAGDGLKCIVLDAEAISDFDSTAAEALENLDVDLERRGIELWIARANGPLCHLLQVTGLTGRIGRKQHLSIRARSGFGLSTALLARPQIRFHRWNSFPGRWFTVNHIGNTIRRRNLMAIKTYKDGTPFTGVIGRTTEESSPAWPEPKRPAEGAPNVLILGAGRCRLRAAIELRRAGRDAGAGQPGRQRPALHQHAHHRPVLALARLHPDRAQPSLDRAGLHHRDFHRLPRLQRHPALRQGHAQRDAAAKRLQYLLLWESGT